MRAYICDWCKQPKMEGERWILGYAADRVGATGIQREISICSVWSDRSAEHPLAVHFCSEDHKDAYVAALFKTVGESRGATRRRQRVSAGKSGGTSHLAIGIGAASIQYSSRAEESRPSRASNRKSTPRRRRAPAQFTASDDIRSHGLSVRLPGNPDLESGDSWPGS